MAWFADKPYVDDGDASGPARGGELCAVCQNILSFGMVRGSAFRECPARHYYVVLHILNDQCGSPRVDIQGRFAGRTGNSRFRRR